MRRLLLLAAVVVAMLAASGGAGAEWDVHPGAGTPIQDATCGAGGIRFTCMPGRMRMNEQLTRKIYEEPDHLSI